MCDENSHENMDNPASVKCVLSGLGDTSSDESQPKQTCEKNEFYGPAQPKVINMGTVIKNIESESLNSLQAYDSDSSSSSEMTELSVNWQNQKGSNNPLSSSSSSSSIDSSSSSDNDDSDDGSSNDNSYNDTPVNANSIESKGAVCEEKTVVQTNGELAAEQLPPVLDLSKLSINVESENFFHMGNVFGIVDKLVTVAAIANTPVYDLDTLLFLDNGRTPLGFVFDVLGPVTSPIYAVRFNSEEDIKKLNIQVRMKVYSAPASEYTQYVFLQQLLNLKGSDASWLGDSEVPAEFADYSDDENECYHRYGNRKHTPHSKRTHHGDSYKKFETTMNQRNILNTKFSKYLDSYRLAHLNKSKSKSKRNNLSHTNAIVPVFNPSIPPPNFSYCTAFYHQQPPGSALTTPTDYVNMVYGLGIDQPGISGFSQNQYVTQNLFMNNLVNNLEQSNSTSCVSHHNINSNPGPSHE